MVLFSIYMGSFDRSTVLIRNQTEVGSQSPVSFHSEHRADWNVSPEVFEQLPGSALDEVVQSLWKLDEAPKAMVCIHGLSSAVWWEVSATVQAGSLCVDDGYETQRNQAKVISFYSLF